MSVGQNAADAVLAAHVGRPFRTCSGVRSGELKLMPRQPLICGSKNAGATHCVRLLVGVGDRGDAPGFDRHRDRVPGGVVAGV